MYFHVIIEIEVASTSTTCGIQKENKHVENVSSQ